MVIWRFIPPNYRILPDSTFAFVITFPSLGHKFPKLQISTLLVSHPTQNLQKNQEINTISFYSPVDLPSAFALTGSKSTKTKEYLCYLFKGFIYLFICFNFRFKISNILTILSGISVRQQYFKISYCILVIVSETDPCAKDLTYFSFCLRKRNKQ